MAKRIYAYTESYKEHIGKHFTTTNVNGFAQTF